MHTSTAGDLGDFGIRLPGAIRKVGRGALKVGKVIMTPQRLAFKFATTPIRNRVNTLVTRRARKLAWDRRRSKTPTQAENVEARAWTKRHLQAQGPQGRLLAFFAGAMDPSAVLLGNFGQGWEAAVLASIPVLVALMAKIITDAAKSGAAPADPSVEQAENVAPPVGPAPVEPEEMQGYNEDEIRLLGLLGQAAAPPSGAGWIAVALGFVAAGAGVVIALRK